MNLADRMESEVRPLISKSKHDGGYNCCGCSTYDAILDHCIRIAERDREVRPTRHAFRHIPEGAPLQAPFAAFTRWSQGGGAADAEALELWERDLRLAQAVLDAADKWASSRFHVLNDNAIERALLAAVRARREAVA